MQVSRGSCLAGQQQRQLESVPVEPMSEYLGTLRTKAASDTFRVSSLAFGSSNDCCTHCGFLRVSMKSFRGCCEKLLPKTLKENVKLFSVRLASKFRWFRT